MKSDKLIDAIGMIDADLLAEADEKFKKGYVQYIKWLVPAAAALLIVIAVIPFLKQDKPIIDNPLIEQTTLSDGQPSTENPNSPIVVPPVDDNHLNSMVLSLKLAKYPQMVQYPSDLNNLSAWYESKRERKQYYGAGKNLDTFFKKTYGEFLSNLDGENKLYSPLNVYMALAMTAEITDGESRQQILDLLGASSIDSLRKQANSMWNANYSDDGAVTSILASSLWLNKNITFNEKVINSLATNYYASSFQGTMGSPEFDKALQQWLNEQTGGMLNNRINEIKLDPETVMAIATTIFYQAKWEAEFQESYTNKRVFHSSPGDVKCDFMNRTEYDELYYWGDNFSAASKKLANSGKIYFILPDENVSVDDLLSDSEALSFMTSNGKWNNSQKIRINLSVPKFDVSSNMDLVKGLKKLGVTDCFDDIKSNFSSLCKNYDEPMYISRVEHGVRVAIDEEGVTATAYTVEHLAGSARPSDEEIDFILDRPFIFVITSDDGLPLFTGVVNKP